MSYQEAAVTATIRSPYRQGMISTIIGVEHQIPQQDISIWPNIPRAR